MFKAFVWLFAIQICSVTCEFLLPSKLYRVERYVTPECAKGKKFDWLVFNNATFQITGGVDKLVLNGWFEVLQDINTSVGLSTFITRCDLKDRSVCSSLDPFSIPSICGISNNTMSVQQVINKLLQTISMEIMKVIEPPLGCPVIKKNKYFIRNHAMDLKLANIFSFETSRWMVSHILSLGEEQIPMICFDLEITIKRVAAGRRQKN